MARRRDATHVRSHRRGGRRRRLVLAPWIVITVVSVLLLSGVSAGYAWLVTMGCSGEPVRITVVSDPSITRILDHLARRWAETEPAIDERCAAVEVVSKTSSDTAQTLGPGWDPRRSGPRPDVWVPEATAWLRLASAREDVAQMLPERQPSLARTPAVIAMPMPMAKAVGWPNAKLSWKQFGSGTLPDGSRTWAGAGHADWGQFRVGMTNPVTSTAGLHALTSVADTNDDGRITDSERRTLNGLGSVMKLYTDGPAKIIGELTRRDAEGEAKVLPYVSAFPMLEHDVRAYNDTNPRVPLAAVYPTDGTADADYPYLTLQAPWSSPARQRVARGFMDFLRGPEGRQTFLDNFYRDPNRRAGGNLDAAHGVRPEVPTVPRAVLVPDSASQTVATWVAANRRTNVLLAMDVSRSMSSPVGGTGQSRVEIAREAALRVVDLLGDDARMGLWTFASGLGGDKDHVELTSVGGLSDVTGGVPRATALQNQLTGLTAESEQDSAVNDTALAAYEHMSGNYLPNATNLVVLISDGKDDGTGASVKDAVSRLAEIHTSDKPARLITIGYGDAADMDALRDLAGATGGRAYQAAYESDLTNLLVTALFN